MKAMILVLFLLTGCQSMNPQFDLYNTSHALVDVYITRRETIEELRQVANERFLASEELISLAPGPEGYNDYIESKNNYIMFGIINTSNEVSYVIFGNTPASYPACSAGGIHLAYVYTDTYRVYIRQDSAHDKSSELLVEAFP